MMHNMVHPQEIQLPIDELTSPLVAQLEFSESELFPETLQNSEVASISSNNVCYEEHSSYNPTNNLSITMDDMNNYNNTTLDYNDTTTTTPAQPPPATTTGPSNSNHPIFFNDDHLDNDISASIDFTASPSFSLPNHHKYFNSNNHENYQEVLFSMPNNNIQISLGDDAGQTYEADHHPYNPEWRSMVAPPADEAAPIFPVGYHKEERCGFMPSVSLPSYNNVGRLMSSIGPMNIGSYFPSTSCLGAAPFSFDSSRINFTAGTSGLFPGNDVSVHHEQEFQGDNINGGYFQSDSVARVLSCSTGDLQALSSESQHLLHCSPSTTLASEISSLEDPNLKVGKLSAEERKRKIHRYLKKRNERNFSKKIKYACRKTLADSRPRVRGRFAKNDELAEIARISTGNNHEDDTDEDVIFFSNPNIPEHQHKVVKGEEDLDSSDIFAHISGVNSFKCNYPIQSWI